MLSEDQRKRVRQVICETLKLEERDLEKADDFGEDLGLTSMDRLQVMAAVEVEFGVHIDESKLDGLRDLDTVYTALDEVLNP
jgi:acyl carrier protein